MDKIPQQTYTLCCNSASVRIPISIPICALPDTYGEPGIGINRLPSLIVMAGWRRSWIACANSARCGKCMRIRRKRGLGVVDFDHHFGHHRCGGLIGLLLQRAGATTMACLSVPIKRNEFVAVLLAQRF